jgi:hypothetical protein
MMANEAGKGDRYRKVDAKKYGENYDRIFGSKVMPNGTTFGDSQKYQLRKYYFKWMKDSILKAALLHEDSKTQMRIGSFSDHLEKPPIEDPGLLPCSELERTHGMSRYPNDLACLIVLLRFMVQKWWECQEDSPAGIEPILVELDWVIANWDTVLSEGSMAGGYKFIIEDDCPLEE